MKQLTQTIRQKDLVRILNEFETKQTISIKELEDFKKAIWKFIMEHDRLIERYNKLKEEKNKKEISNY